MRWHAARSMEEESSRPIQREPGEGLIKTADVTRAYNEWLKKRGFAAGESWFKKNRRKKDETPTA